MPLPRLLDPVDIEVQPIDTEATIYDDVRREPASHIERGVTLTLKAQVQWTSKDRGDPDPSGTVKRSQGYVVLDQRELDRKSYSPSRGDKIVKMAGVDEALYIHSFQPAGHRRGRAYLLVVNFRDRQPTRTT